MTFSPELLADKEAMRLMTARNHQSHSLITAAKELLHKSTEIDLSNICTEILHKYPETHNVMFFEDMRTDHADVVFCGRMDNESGKPIANLWEAKEFVNDLLLTYKLSDRESIVERVINVREYAAQKPDWF